MSDLVTCTSIRGIKEKGKKGSFLLARPGVYAAWARGRDWGERLTTLVILQYFGWTGLGAGLHPSYALLLSRPGRPTALFRFPRASLFTVTAPSPPSLSYSLPLTRSRSSLSFHPAGFLPFDNFVTVAHHHHPGVTSSTSPVGDSHPIRPWRTADPIIGPPSLPRTRPTPHTMPPLSAMSLNS